jgi:prepilin-type N-terminal cleavage/methylation domain-containing protein
MKTRTSSNSAFTLVEIMIVVGIIGLLAAIAIPNFIKARTTAQTNACINNLRQIDGAIQQWALEERKTSSSSVTYPDISAYLKNSVICPSGGTAFSDSYTVNTVSDKPLCKRISSAHIVPPDTAN